MKDRIKVIYKASKETPPVVMAGVDGDEFTDIPKAGILIMNDLLDREGKK